MSKTAQAIIGLCILLWMVLAIGVCGSLDCNTMTVLDAIQYIAVRTCILACIVGITVTADMWHKGIKKPDKDGHPSQANEKL